MKITFASYEHSCIGFPKVVLKWAEEDGKWSEGRIVVKGIIQSTVNHGAVVAKPWRWTEIWPKPFAESEMARFDDWVRETFKNDISVQG